MVKNCNLIRYVSRLVTSQDTHDQESNTSSVPQRSLVLVVRGQRNKQKRNERWKIKLLDFTQTIGMVTALFVLAHVGLPSSKAVALPSPGLLGLDQHSSFLGLLRSYKIELLSL